MKNQMLSACPNHLRGELQGLFARFPFEEMPIEYHRATGLHGVTFEDGSIGLLPAEPEIMLAMFLHEVAHASLLCAGHPDGLAHGNDFVRICRELQVRFGVASSAWHSYDQQDAVIKTTAQHSAMRAAGAALAVEYDPTQRALHAAGAAMAAEHRHTMRYVLIMGGGCIAFIAGIAAPWGAWFASALNSDMLKLAAGGAIAAWIYFSTRG